MSKDEMVARIVEVLSTSDPDFESFDTIAHRILDAMREPTDAMNEAGDDTFDWTSSDANGHWYPQHADATECWRAMIDAASARMKEPQR